MLFSPVFGIISVSGLFFTGASSYEISSEIWLDSCLPHPRAYACSPNLTDFSLAIGCPALRQFPTFAQRLLWHRWLIFELLKR